MKNFFNKRILVTGGAGFLGSHLCERLLIEGHEVLCCGNFYTGRRSNIVQFLLHPLFKVMRHDICFPIYVEVDEIYNLACPASPIHYQFDPVQTTKTSVHGSINMLGLAKRLKAKILQASTSEVYGDPGVHPQPESYWGNVNPIGPRSCYGEGFPGVGIESFAVGTAPVITDLPSFRGFYEHKKNVLMVPRYEPDAMAAAIIHILEHPDKRCN